MMPPSDPPGPSELPPPARALVAPGGVRAWGNPGRVVVRGPGLPTVASAVGAHPTSWLATLCLLDRWTFDSDVVAVIDPVWRREARCAVYRLDSDGRIVARLGVWKITPRRARPENHESLPVEPDHRSPRHW
jgi:hypothetical protein